MSFTGLIKFHLSICNLANNKFDLMSGDKNTRILKHEEKYRCNGDKNKVLTDLITDKYPQRNSLKNTISS